MTMKITLQKGELVKLTMLSDIQEYVGLELELEVSRDGVVNLVYSMLKEAGYSIVGMCDILQRRDNEYQKFLAEYNE